VEFIPWCSNVGMRHTVIAATILLISSNAFAADLSVSVRTSGGAPVPNAGVTVHPAGRAAFMPARLGRPTDMVQSIGLPREGAVHQTVTVEIRGPPRAHQHSC